MKNLKDMYTPAQVDELIDEIGRLIPGLEERARSRTFTVAERADDQKLNAMCSALERRDELQREIKEGRRSPDGSVNVRV